MDQITYENTFSELLIEKKFDKAEQLVANYHRSAVVAGDIQMLNGAFGCYVQLYCSIEPPNLEKAEFYCLERERNSDTAYNKLQTAMFLFYVAGQYERAAQKLQEAITNAKLEEDVATAYTSLALLGQTLLKLGQEDRAADLVRELRGIISSPNRLPIGDETNFLEAAMKSSVEPHLVREIARLLAPLCSDPEFSRRLSKLSE